MANGASRDDLRMLYNHSTSAVTDVYIHDKGERVGKVAEVIRLFPENKESEPKNVDSKILGNFQKEFLGVSQIGK